MSNKLVYELNVVVTACNNGKDIRRCLNSIVRQWKEDENDFHLTIAYDDGSKDNTLDICKQYRDRYGRFIELIILPHCYVGQMRNMIAKDTIESYITFVDGDDFLPENAIKNILKVIKETHSDTIIGKLRTNFPGGKSKIFPPFKTSKDGKSVICETFAHPVVFKTDVYNTKLYCRPDVKTHEDRVSGYLLPKLASVYVIDEVIYDYGIALGSMVRNKTGRIPMFNDLIVVWEELKKEKHRFTDGEWELIKEDLEWSMISPMFFLQCVDKENRLSQKMRMYNYLTMEFSGWKDNETLRQIRNSNYIVRQYVDMLLYNPSEKEFLKFTSGYKMKIVGLGTEIYSVGGIRGWIVSKLLGRT